mgnify:CR=1 FL=1|tara:strand:- start:802 stop:1008 length:207 start_codon:yes stop_codon:yes gene_type:complete
MKNKVEGFADIYKDTESGVIVSRATTDRDRYRESKRQAHMNLDSQKEIADLKGEINELKQLLHQILNK